MRYAEICQEVHKIENRFHETDPFKLCDFLGILVLRHPLGTGENAIKGFFLEINRIKTITINSDLPAAVQRIIAAHELGHALLHRKSGIQAFHDIGLFDESSMFEKDANLFAAEYLLKDEDVLKMLNTDCTFFSAAAALYVPMELLDFKFRILKWKGYKFMEPPINAPSNFLRNLEVPNHAGSIC